MYANPSPVTGLQLQSCLHNGCNSHSVSETTIGEIHFKCHILFVTFAVDYEKPLQKLTLIANLVFCPNYKTHCIFLIQIINHFNF